MLSIKTTLGIAVLDNDLQLWNEPFDTGPTCTYATNQICLNNSGRGPPNDHSCVHVVWWTSNERFLRCCRENVDARQSAYMDGQEPVAIAHKHHVLLRWNKSVQQGTSLSLRGYSPWSVYQKRTLYLHLWSYFNTHLQNEKHPFWLFNVYFNKQKT